MLVSLKEMCEKLNITRRSIQCYEKVGLLKPTARNKYGHLLYEESLMERVKEIKFLNYIGFKIVKIRDIIDAPVEKKIEQIRIRIKELEEECRETNRKIEKINEFIKSLEEGKDDL